MGACASASKQFKGEVAVAPPPEAPKEETTGEVKPEVVDNDKVVDVVKVDDKQPSLESLLSEGDEVKKDTTSNERKEEKVEQETEKVETPVEKATEVKKE